jgi:Asp-tRNA(Asn)/Glu-tRNA(Gln) amidotransferase A subunit family amidase
VSSQHPPPLAAHTLLFAVLADVPKWFPQRAKHFQERCDALRTQMNTLLTGDTVGTTHVLIAPSYPYVAPEHNHPILSPFDFSIVGIFNALHLPVTTVPMGLSAESAMPLGVQLVGAHGHDHAPIALASLLEEEIGGWIPPPAFFPDPLEASTTATAPTTT